VSVINMELSPQELKEFERAFRMINFETDGSITSKDLAVFMRNLGRDPTEHEVLSMINEVDIDGNGSVELPEFISSISYRMCKMPDDDELHEAFRVFDRDNSGFISADKLRTVMLDLNTKLTDDETEELIREADLDGDGVLSFDEFCQMMGNR
ncbi:hypothetical protein KR044_004229, partial [Drosophila immigrans]